MFSHSEFDDWIRSFANTQVKIPENKSRIVYDIPAPRDGLYLRVDPKIDITQTKMAGSPEIMFVTVAGRSVFVDTLPSDCSDWKRELADIISDAFGSWRDFVDK